MAWHESRVRKLMLYRCVQGYRRKRPLFKDPYKSTDIFPCECLDHYSIYRPTRMNSVSQQTKGVYQHWKTSHKHNSNPSVLFTSAICFQILSLLTFTHNLCDDVCEARVWIYSDFKCLLAWMCVFFFVLFLRRRD